MRKNHCFSQGLVNPFILLPKDGILIFAPQKSECRKKVWEKGVEFEEGKKGAVAKPEDKQP